MGIELKVKDQSSSGKTLFETIIKLPIESITVKQLIETRVAQEVEEYNIEAAGKFKGLVQPSEAEILLNGFGLKQGVLVDVYKQQKTAVSAFIANHFFILVNDSQVTELNETILITPNTVVCFLKLVPLVGG